MNRQMFLSKLRKRLSCLPKAEIEERLTFYGEMIEDRMEEGLSEEAAILSIGTIDEIIAELPLKKEKMAKLKAWEIVLLILGFPVWFPLLVAAVAVLLSVYVSMWSVIISLWAVFGSLVICSLGSIAAGVVIICTGNTFSGIAMFGCGPVCAGFSILLFFCCKAATKGILILTKKIAVWKKNCFIGREAVQ